MKRPKELQELANISDEMDKRYVGILAEPYNEVALQQITVDIPAVLAEAVQRFAQIHETSFDSAMSTALLESSALEDYV